jgi:hypothetical protein
MHVIMIVMGIARALPCCSTKAARQGILPTPAPPAVSHTLACHVLSLRPLLCCSEHDSYSLSKLCNIVFTLRLAKLLQKGGTQASLILSITP